MNTKETKEQNTHKPKKKKTIKNQNKQVEDKKYQNRAKQLKNPTVITLSFFSFGQLLLGMESCPGICLTDTVAFY